MIKEERILITGCSGQLGKALAIKYPNSTKTDRAILDIANQDDLKKIDWSLYDVVINAAAYVNADDSETQEGRRKTWIANSVGPRNLSKICLENNIHLIHFSSEYVFDGSKSNHSEEEPFTPLSVYGETKCAGDIAVSTVPKHHIIRTSWVVDDGHNFVRTMVKLANMRIDPKVVNDQYGRITFVSELVRAVDYILNNNIAPGTYNVSNAGPIKSWADIAADAFEYSGYDRKRVKFITTDEYKKDKDFFAPRPVHSDLSLAKIQSTGFVSTDYREELKKYIESLEEF